MANRRTLHRTKLEAFLGWCSGKGYEVETKERGYEVARVRVEGWKSPVLIYDRHDGDHLTIFGYGKRLVSSFIRESARA